MRKSEYHLTSYLLLNTIIVDSLKIRLKLTFLCNCFAGSVNHLSTLLGREVPFTVQPTIESSPFAGFLQNYEQKNLQVTQDACVLLNRYPIEKPQLKPKQKRYQRYCGKCLSSVIFCKGQVLQRGSRSTQVSRGGKCRDTFQYGKTTYITEKNVI